MAAVAFDTLKCARRLKNAGYTDKQAEVQAEIMAEAFVFNMDTLATRDYMDARFGEQDAQIDARFLEQSEQFNVRFTAMDIKFTELRGELKGELGLQRWMLAAIAASTVLPMLASVFKLA